MRLLARLRRAITTTPKLRDWIEAGLALAVFAAAVAPIGLSTGLLVETPRPWAEILPIALLVFFVPVLAEEAAFRGSIPDRGESPRAGLAIALSTVAFTAWHLLATLWLPHAATIFTRPDFLAAAALLGLVCAILRRRSGSIWTAVAVHWLVVVAWLAWLGGPMVVELV